VAPSAYLVAETWQRLGQGVGVAPALWTSAWNTLRVAALATVATVLAGLVLAWALRLAQARRRTRLAATELRLDGLGYSVPATMLPNDLLPTLAWFDNGASLVVGSLGLERRMLLMALSGELVLAYVLRFAISAAGGTKAGMA